MNRANARSVRARGAAAVQVVVILVPVLFALIGFAVDLGIMYSVKGELKTAASSMALAAAEQLIGTDTSTTAASAAAQATIETSTGLGNKYYFHGLPIGQTTGSLISTISDPAYFSTAASAIASGSTGGQVGGSLAKYVRMTVTGQTQLLFWSFLPIVSQRNVTVLATAVAGISAPLCVACGIEPFAVAAIDQSDTTDFGFVLGTEYSFSYLCTAAGGVTSPPLLAGATAGVSYVLLNRFNANSVAFPDEMSQAFQDGAGGLPGNTDSMLACFTINNTEVIWPDATVNACNATAVAPLVTAALCGLDARFESTPQAACAGIPSIDTLASIYQPDTDVNNYPVYTDYIGDGRRIITIPIVDMLSSTGNMTVLGFRQFLVEPDQDATNLNPGDQYGRFVALYIGSVAPVKQGSFQGCQQPAGPGKVVLHQ